MNTQPIKWKESMATGIEDIDRQHRFLIDTLREATELLRDKNDDILLGEIAKDLLGYAITHFETEESMMLEHGYRKAHPETATEHIAQHREFSRRVVAIAEHLREGRAVSHDEVLTFLNNWLRDHILGIDQLFGDFMRQVNSRDKDDSPF